MIPRDGGNEFHGSLYAGVTDGSWQSSNLNDDLRAKGATARRRASRTSTTSNPAAGGPILRDKLWFFAAMRWMSVDEKVVDAYFPDGSPAIVDQYVNIPLARVTYAGDVEGQGQRVLRSAVQVQGPGVRVRGRAGQRVASPQLGRGELPQPRHEDDRGAEQPVSLRAGLHADCRTPAHRLSAAGLPGERAVWRHHGRVAAAVERDPLLRDAVRVRPELRGDPAEPWYRDVSRLDILTNERTVAATGYAGTLPDRNHFTTALSYVTGSHTLKGGFQVSWARTETTPRRTATCRRSGIAAARRSPSS